MHTLSLIFFAASLANAVRLYFRTTRRPAPRTAVAEPSLTAYLAADVTAGLPHEDMVRAAIVEYMADERSDVHARISKLESELDFYILGKGEGVPLSDTFPVMKQYGMVGPLDPYPDAKPVEREHGDELCDCGSPICALRRRFAATKPPRARWYPGVLPRCPVCDGSGLYTLEEPTCPQCGGTGICDTGQRETR